MYYILGIDPGITQGNPTGWVILEGKQDKIVSLGEIAFPDRLDWTDRIQRIGERLQGEAKRSSIKLIGIESPWVGKDPQVALKLGAQLGSVLQIARTIKAKVYIVQPAEAEAALMGTAGATRNIKKDAMRIMANRRYNTNVSSHQADAIAVALHVYNIIVEAQRMEMAKEQSEKKVVV